MNLQDIITALNNFRVASGNAITDLSTEASVDLPALLSTIAVEGAKDLNPIFVMNPPLVGYQYLSMNKLIMTFMTGI
jgi:hypothetical protein